MGGDELQRLREALDRVDRRLLADLAERLEVVREVARLKERGETGPRDRAREAEVLERVAAIGQEQHLDPDYVKRLYKAILDHSVRKQQAHLLELANEGPPALRVGYQGTNGCYSSLAASRFYGHTERQVSYRGFVTFRELLQGVVDGQIDEAVLPIENTTAGSINESYDLLAEMGLHVVGEEIWKVEHVLLAPRSVPVTHIRRIRSHPQALAQCSEFLGGLRNCLIEAYADTAMACEAVSVERDLSQAAIAGEEAGRHFGLEVVARDIANQPNNFTRFVVVAREAVVVDPRIEAKTSVIFSTRHEEGALLKCLNALAGRHLNLTKLESRPVPERPFEYRFYVDFHGNVADAATREALEEIRALTGDLTVLGSYPARERPT